MSSLQQRAARKNDLNSRANRLLKQLGPADLQRLLPHLEPIRLNFKEPLFEQGGVITHVYFPAGGVISVVTELHGREVVETATVGREGLVGLPVLFGARRAPWRAYCQIPGEGFRIRAEEIKKEFDGAESVRLPILRYANALMALLAQSTACIAAHGVEERMCRWLLMTRDRVDSDEFILTQEFLGQMLGVRRPTVSLAGGTLQRAGLIKYSRGRITVLDHAGLESAACECYASVKSQLDEALGEDSR